MVDAGPYSMPSPLATVILPDMVGPFLASFPSRGQLLPASCANQRFDCFVCVCHNGSSHIFQQVPVECTFLTLPAGVYETIGMSFL